MIDGKYIPINYFNFECPRAFDVLMGHTRRARHFGGGCGTHCLQTLTGLTGRFLEQKRPNVQGRYYGCWTNNTMLDFLRKRGFKIEELAKYCIACKNPAFQWYDYKTPITSQHVLLCDMVMNREEASWVIITSNHVFHNLEIANLMPLMFVNRPTQRIWMISHEDWK